MDEITRSTDSGYIKCTITTTADLVELDIMGSELTDNGSAFTTVSCRNGNPTIYTLYTSDWEFRSEEYTITVDGTPIIKNKSVPIVDETVDINGTTYIITYKSPYN